MVILSPAGNLLKRWLATGFHCCQEEGQRSNGSETKIIIFSIPLSTFYWVLTSLFQLARLPVGTCFNHFISAGSQGSFTVQSWIFYWHWPGDFFKKWFFLKQLGLAGMMTAAFFRTWLYESNFWKILHLGSSFIAGEFGEIRMCLCENGNVGASSAVSGDSNLRLVPWVP